MSFHLSLFQIRFSRNLSNRAFVLTPRPVRFLFENWVITGHLRNLHRLVLHKLKIELLKRIKRHKIIKIDNRTCVDLFHEGSDIGFVLNWHLDISCSHRNVECKLVLNILNIIFLVIVRHDSHVLSCFPVFDHHAAAVGSVEHLFVRQSLFDFGESLACSGSSNEFVDHFQENIDESLSHGKMVVFVNIPLWKS